MDGMTYLDFDLMIQRAGEGYRVQVIKSPAGEIARAFQLPFTDIELENFLLRIGNRRRGVRRIDSPEVQAAKEFGGRLFHAVFDDEVGNCLSSSLEQSLQQNQRLRIRLRLTDVPQLADLPWEFLYNPSLNRFLALAAETPIVRYLDLPQRIQSLSVAPPLRVLVMISSPSDYLSLDVEREWGKLREALGSLAQRGVVTIERLNEATLSALRHQLRQGEHHIFHFIGHGGFDQQTQEGVLVLEDEQKRGRLVSGQDLGILLHNHPSLRLAVLNACEGARSSTHDPFAGVAASLVQQGIPAVIAMQFEVTDEAAITFAQEFYGAIASSYPVDASLTEARLAIFSQGHGLEWGTPVLYLRAPDGRIFDVESAEIPTTQPPNHLPTSRDSRQAGATTQPPAPPASVTVPPLETPEGTVELQSPFYVERSSDATALKAIRGRGVTITIKGPRQVGKSSLLVRINAAARESGKRTAFLDFQQFDTAALTNADVFFRQFCAWLTNELDMEDRTDEYWNAPLGNIQRCTRYTSRYLLQELGSPLVLVMDEVDSIFDSPFRSDFFGMLRSWHNNRAATPLWKNLDLALVTSTEPHLFIKNLTQSPFNVGIGITLEDFTTEQVADLNRRHGSPFNADEERQLTELVGGHPYLVRLALYLVASGSIAPDGLFANAVADPGPFADHLRNLLFRLRERDDLAQAFRQVIRNHTCPDEEVFFRLRGAGLARREGHEVLPRCQLYANYFQEHLHD